MRLFKKKNRWAVLVINQGFLHKNGVSVVDSVEQAMLFTERDARRIARALVIGLVRARAFEVIEQ